MSNGEYCRFLQFIFDYCFDPALSTGRMDFIQTKGYEEVVQLMEMGYTYTKQVHSDG